MPIINIEVALQGSGEEENDSKIVSLQTKSNKCTDIYENRDYTLSVTMSRKNRTSNLKAHSPCFLRGKDEGWFLILGDISQRELLALKRVSGISGPRRSNQLQFTAPPFNGRMKLTLYIISDCYMGLDQQYEFNLNVIPER
ncbi:activating signal cointegrator 1 complex subunit 3-like [Belonocnema kinseyi]|uniref:activating signal cointegrator 1 complex subunit 3-like n=1 Tax=Belonocnema kinseyi TaxID=2817044 RepID=UPI00143D9413|nr:activating signal cointegrator 1 complex subunit 3-like [Belonocnema kinseyi]